MIDDTTKNKKPKWLRKLERESWQAELLISGATIIGLLRLPDILLVFFENIAVGSSDLTSKFLLAVFLYLLSGVYILAICFIIHFTVRALWIALLGLNSVFPNGIQIKPYFNMSEGVLRKMKKEFPDIGSYNDKLDRFGSVIFSIAFAFVMLFMSILLVILLVGLLIKVIYSFYPEILNHISTIGGVVYIVLFFPFILLYLAKKFKVVNEDKLDATQYTFMKGLGKTTYTIFYTPINYIIYTLITNFSYRSTMIGMMLGMTLSIAIATNKMGSSDSLRVFLNSTRYISFNQLDDFHYKWNYRDEIETSKNQFTPSIQSDIVSGPYVKLFIPFIGREENAMEENEPLIEISGDLFKRDSLRKLQLQQYKNFNKILLNDVPLDEQDCMKKEMGTTMGMIVFIPTSFCSQGKNILKIEKQMFMDSIQKKVIIPFFYHSE